MTDGERIAQLEAECQSLQHAMNMILQLLANKIRPELHSYREMHKEWQNGTGRFAAQDSPVADAAAVQRKHLTYATVIKVRRERAEHPEESIRGLSRRLELPESSVRACLKLSDARLRELKKKDMEDADEAYRITGGNA